jgi:hypothetical protein
MATLLALLLTPLVIATAAPAASAAGAASTVNPNDLASLQRAAARQTAANPSLRRFCWWAQLQRNGSFEVPPVPGATWFLTPGGGTVMWKTTNSGNNVELWGVNMGVPPFTGQQFAEINSTAIDSLYEDVATVPGTLLFWRLAHRARNTTTGVDIDTMQVAIGATGGSLIPQRPIGQFSPTIRSTDLAWHTRAGVYRVPPGQTSTQVAFQALSGPAGYGNLLDGVVIIGLVCRGRR